MFKLAFRMRRLAPSLLGTLLFGTAFAADDFGTIFDTLKGVYCAIAQYASLTFLFILVVIIIVAGIAWTVGSRTGEGVSYAVKTVGGVVVVLILFAIASRMLGQPLSFSNVCSFSSSTFHTP